MNSDSDLLTKVMKGVGFIFLGIILSKLAGYVFRVIIARFLGPESYGWITLGFAVIGVITTLCLLGLPQGIVRFVSEYKAKKEISKILGIIRVSLELTGFFSVIVSIFLFVLSDYIAIRIFSDPAFGVILRVMAFGIPFKVLLTTFEKTILAMQRVEYNTLSRSFGENLVKIVLSVFFVLFGYGIIWVASAWVFSLFCGLLFLMLSLHYKILPLNGMINASNKDFKKLFKFSFPLLLTDVFAFLLTWTDTILIGIFLLSADVGIYNAAIPTAMLVYVIPTAMRTMFFPVMSEHYAKKENFIPFYKKISDWIVVLTLPVAAYLILFGKQFLELFFGEIYVSGFWALGIICFSYFIYALANTSHIMLYVMKKTKVIMFNTIVAIVVNILLNIWLIPKYGIIGAAIATGVAVIIRAVLILSEGLYFFGSLPITNRTILPFIAVIIPSYLSFLFQGYVSHIFTLILWSAIFAIIYGLILLLLRFFQKEDFEIIKKMENKLPFKINFAWKILKLFS
jgi:O-antigen/teichoic acid export membrane protein